jgi:MFS family permease
MFGESQNPRWDELKTSAVVGTVALGVGLGSPLAGWLSGRKVELGLVPIGAVGMILGCILAGFSLGYIPGLVACTILIGICTGFYLVPLFTLLQYRAPKSSKGDMVATSNFINVTGAIAASVIFAALVEGAQTGGLLPNVPTTAVAEGRLQKRDVIRGRPVHFQVGDLIIGHVPTPEEKRLHVWDHLFGPKPSKPRPNIEIDRSVSVGDKVVVSYYRLGEVDHYVVRLAGQPLEEEYDSGSLPRFLFFGAGLMTFGVLLVLRRRVRDLSDRGLTLLRSVFIGPRFTPEGLAVVPGDGPVILLIETTDPSALRAIRSAVDRYVVVFDPKSQDPAEIEAARVVLNRGDVVGVMIDAPGAATLVNALDGLNIRVRTEGRLLVFNAASN